MADRNPRRASNWEMRCKLCGVRFLEREIVQDAKDHFDRVHGGAGVAFELVWVGRGPTPTPPPGLLPS